MKKILLILLVINFSSSVFADPKMELGLDVFNKKAICSACHTLENADAVGVIGPNLDELKPLMPQVILSVTNGVGVMPAFESILSLEEIEAVAYFVSKSTSQ